MLLAVILLVALFLRTYELDRIPPGPYYDEAAAKLLAGDVASGRALPIFITAYTGHEVLFYYLAAALMRLMGTSVLALRLTSALVGVATVLTTYALAREWFDDEPVVESHWLGLFAAALMATSFWHVSVSRYGLRAITLPLAQSLMLLALWRGLRLNSWKWIIAAGVFCGLIAYTYLSSRIVPVALAILLPLVLLAERRQWRLRLTQLGSLALVALIVFAPLGIFFATHPETFSVRMNQISILAEGGGSAWQTIALRNTLRALQVFTWRGDPDARLNLPDLPMFQGLAPAFYLGLLVVILRLANRSGFLGRVRYATLVIWPLVMLIPTILADPTQVPHSLRAIGVMPLVFFIPALGLVAVLSMLQRYVRGQRWLIALAAAAFLVTLTTSAMVTFQNYFVRWARQPKLYYSNDGDLADMTDYLNSLPDDGRTLYVGAPDYRHPTVAALARNYSRMKWVQGGEAFVFSPNPAIYAWSHAALPDDWWLARYWPESSLAQKLAPDGTLAYVIHTRDQPPVISPTYPLHANFGGVIEAIGYDVLRDRPSGGRTDAAVYWRILRKPERGDYSGFITLNDAWGMNWGQGGSFTYPSEQWVPGEIIAERVRVQTDDGTPPGSAYTLKLGWWSASNGQRLPVIDTQGNLAGTTITIGPITVTRRIRALDLNTLNISRRLNADFGGLRLLGFDQWPSSLRQGESEFVTLYWQAMTAPLPDRQVTLQLRAPDQSIRVLSRSGPAHGMYPTSQWEAGEFVADRLALRISPDTPPGTYTLEAQVDDLPIQPLGPFVVQAIARTWTPPTPQHPMSVTLGAQIMLAGYDIKSPISKSQEVELRLYWQALREMNENYTVFVHLVDKDGIVRGQKDNAPVNGAYPTSLWQPGEFVADTYTLPLPPDLPPGDYAIKVGMYLAETGARLPVAGNGDQVELGKVSIVR